MKYIYCILIFCMISTVVVAKDTQITIRGNEVGREFAGYGTATSGTDALLLDYDEKYVDSMFNFMFAEDGGLNFKICKVEIGGGSNDTTISNASHMPTRDNIDPYAGYAWKILKKVHETNKDVKLAGLHWTLPNWVNNDIDEAYYIFTWVKLMKEVHGLDIDYIGGQRNEEDALQPDFTKELRRLLNENGYKNVKIVAADGVYNPWKVADLMATDTKYNNAIDIIGGHYVSTSSTVAQSFGKPIWQSEGSGWNADYECFGQVKSFISQYLNGKITGFMRWGISQSNYENSFWSMIGEIDAKQPWSGYWGNSATGYAVMHINNFAKFGWQVLEGASGTLDDGLGTYIGMRSPDNKDFNVMLETFNSTTDNKVNIKLSEGMTSSKKVYVYDSDIQAGDKSGYLVRVAELTPKDGTISFTLKPKHAYNFSTIFKENDVKTYEGEKNAQPKSWQLPYYTDFEQDALGAKPRYAMDIEGSYQVYKGENSTKTLHQTTINPPVRWYGGGSGHDIPYFAIGDPYWTDYKATVDVMLDEADYAEIAVRANEQKSQSLLSRKGYYMRLYKNGKWEMVRITHDDSQIKNNELVLKSGTYEPTKWTNIGISAQVNTISGYINGKLVGEVTDKTHTVGNVFIATSGFVKCQFDNLAIVRTDGAIEIATTLEKEIGNNIYLEGNKLSAKKQIVNDTQVVSVDIFTELGAEVTNRTSDTLIQTNDKTLRIFKNLPYYYENARKIELQANIGELIPISLVTDALGLLRVDDINGINLMHKKDVQLSNFITSSNVNTTKNANGTTNIVLQPQSKDATATATVRGATNTEITLNFDVTLNDVSLSAPTTLTLEDASRTPLSTLTFDAVTTPMMKLSYKGGIKNVIAGKMYAKSTYKIALTLNLKTGTQNITVDGQEIFKDLPLMGDRTNTVSSIVIQSYNQKADVQVLFDNLLVQ